MGKRASKVCLPLVYADVGVDIVERLERWAKWCHENGVKSEVQRVLYDAADEIEGLRDAVL